MNDNQKMQKDHARREAEMDGNMSQEQQKARAMADSMRHTTCEPNEGLYE